MNEDRFSKHIEFKDGLKAYKNYLSGLNIEARKKLDAGKLGFLDKISLNRNIKKRQKLLEVVGGIEGLDGKAHLSGDMIAKQNEAVIAALNALPVLDNNAEQKISASYVNEESKIFDAERKSIIEARQKERALLASITPDLGFVKVGSNEYKKLESLFSESLGDLSVFDLKVNTVHQPIDDKLTADLIATWVTLLNDYKKYVLEGKTKELESLPVNTVDRVKDILILHAKNKFCLNKLEELLGIMPKKNVNTCKLIEQSINSYREKVAKVEKTVNVDFNFVAAVVREVEEEERRKRAEEERKVTLPQLNEDWFSTSLESSNGKKR